MTSKDLIEACDILVKLEQEFSVEEARLSEISNEHAMKIDELDQQITVSRRNEDVDFRVFSPRNISTGTSDRIKALESEKKQFEREKKDAAIKAEADKQAAVTQAKADAKAEHDVEMAKTRAEYELRIKKERLAVKDDGTPLCWKGGNRNGQQLTKDEAIKWLGGQLKVSQTVNSALLDRLRVLRDLLFATCSMNFKRVVEIIVDQWKAGMKHFAKGMKDFIWSAISVEKTEAGRKSYVDDAVHFAKMLAKTDPDLELDDKALKPLYDDALKIADGTWESYHQKRDQLFDAAVIALVEMGNCQNQRHLNQKQANIIEAFLAFDGGDRIQLCEEIWNVASPKVNYYWRDGTFDALEELRTRELNHRTYGNGRGL